MNRENLAEIVNYIVNQGIQAISENTDEQDFTVDYMGIFSKNEAEFDDLKSLLLTLGKTGDKTATQSGVTVLLDEPFNTPTGLLKVLKIRKPDPTRPQRGAPDFRIDDYQKFKEKYFINEKNSNLSLMLRNTYEMLELKGDDVLVYFPSRHFDDRQL